MKREYISDIRRSLEPSAELKRRVMERAAALEAGRKTFGNERTTADSRHNAAFGTKEKKEKITMSINKSGIEMSTVKSRLPAAILSAAACAAIVIGVAAVGLRGGDSELITESGVGAAPGAQYAGENSAADEQTAPVNEESAPEDVMTVTINDGSSYTITDKDRIAAINALAEKVRNMKDRVWNGEEYPTERTIEYTLDGEQHKIDISEGQYCGGIVDKYLPKIKEGEMHPEFCEVITIDGKSYVLFEATRGDEPYYHLTWATEKGGNLTYQTWNNDNYDLDIYKECQNEAAAGKLSDIIGAVREGGKPQFETDFFSYWDGYDELPKWETVRTTCSFCLEGCYYDVDLFWDSDMIFVEVYDWHDGSTHYELYKDTQNMIPRLDDVFDALTNGSEIPEDKDSDTKNDTQNAADSAETQATVTTVTVVYPDVPDESSEVKSDVTSTAKDSMPETVEKTEEQTEKTEEQTVEDDDDMVTVPDVVGLSEDDALDLLKKYDLMIKINFRRNEAPENTIYMQSLEAGTKVKSGSDITIECSTGPDQGTVAMEIDVPVPEGLSGNWLLDAYLYQDSRGEMYSDMVDNLADHAGGTVTVRTGGQGEGKLFVYLRKADQSEDDLIEYAQYSIDFENKTYELITALNTEAVLNAN